MICAYGSMSAARSATCQRDRRPSFVRMRWTWTPTVPGALARSSAIWRSVYPPASSRATSRSRRVSGSMGPIESPQDTVGEFSLGRFRQHPAARTTAGFQEGRLGDQGGAGASAEFANGILTGLILLGDSRTISG
jgi:hypothetical protein